MRKARLERGSPKDRENRLNLLKNLEIQLHSFSNLELKIILAIYHQEIISEDKESLIERITLYIPSLEIKRCVDNISKIRNFLQFVISLDNTEFNVLIAIYSIDSNLDKEEQVISIFKLRSLKKLEKDILNFNKVRILIMKLEELNDYEFEILFKDENHNVADVFKNYSYQSIRHKLSKLNQIRIYIEEFNKLSIYDIDYLLTIKSLKLDDSKEYMVNDSKESDVDDSKDKLAISNKNKIPTKEDKIKIIIENCSFSEIHHLLNNIDKINKIREDLEEFNSFELNMLLLLNGKALSFPKEKQILKIIQEIPLNNLKTDLIRIKHLTQLHESEFLIIEEGLKRSSFKDLAIFSGNESSNNHNLKELFEKSYMLILDNYDVINDKIKNSDDSDYTSKNQANLDIFF